MFDKKKIMDQVSKDLDDGKFGDVKIEKRGENKPVDVVATKRTRIEPAGNDQYKNPKGETKRESREG